MCVGEGEGRLAMGTEKVNRGKERRDIFESERQTADDGEKDGESDRTRQ